MTATTSGRVAFHPVPVQVAQDQVGQGQAVRVLVHHLRVAAAPVTCLLLPEDPVDVALVVPDPVARARARQRSIGSTSSSTIPICSP